MEKIWRKLGTLCLLLGLFFAISMTGNAAADDIAGGVIDEEYGQITWRIDKNGHLTVEGWGDVADPERLVGGDGIPWRYHQKYIISAKIDVSEMRNASYLFADMENLKSVDLSNFDTSNVRKMYSMFLECKSLESLDVSKFNTQNVTDMGSMFFGCQNLTSIDVGNFDTANVKSMYGMFGKCYRLKEIELRAFNTSNVTDMGAMFSHDRSLQTLDLSNFNTKKVRYVAEMFDGCTSLEKLDISSFHISNVSNIGQMFEGCKKLEYLDLSGFEIDTPKYWDRIFWGCDNLRVLKSPQKVSNELEIYLPQNNMEAWYQMDGKKISCLPHTDSKSVTLVKVQIPGFKDVHKDEWFAANVQYVANKGLMNGYQQKFTPNEPITRAMVIQTIYNMEGKPAVADYRACDELNDVYQDWYTDAVCWAYNEGITTGYDDTKTFKVDEPVTREQLATFFYRYAQWKGYDCTQQGSLSSLRNSDKVSFYAEESVKWAVGAGLIKGIEIYSSGLNVGVDLAPQGTATRAQMATILRRFCEAYKIKEGIMVPGEASFIPEDAFLWNGHYYAVFDNCFNWEVAKTYCESRGGHLAVIDSAEENEALYNFIKENGYTSAYFGLSDTAEEGKWTWITGEEAAYTYWNELEPSGGTDENYAMFFYLYEDGTWNDAAFSENVYDGGNAYICEWE